MMAVVALPWNECCFANNVGRDNAVFAGWQFFFFRPLVLKGARKVQCLAEGRLDVLAELAVPYSFVLFRKDQDIFPNADA